MKFSTKNYGFGLIEILISIFIVAFGVLAVGVLQTNVISSSNENQARQIALQIAQSRIDFFRDYTQEFLDGVVTDDAELKSHLDNNIYSDTSILSLIANGKLPENIASSIKSSQIYEYSLNEIVSLVDDNSDGENDGINFKVKVFWFDSSGSSQNVSLDTRFSFVDPSASGGNAGPPNGYIEAPTGRAHIGDGTLSADDKLNSVESNSDGTAIYGDSDDLGGEFSDLLLAVGDDVVLTLEDACVIKDDKDGDIIGEYDCTDFVRISGRVYFDDSLIIGSGANALTVSNMAPQDMFVLASDAAYCSRSYIKDSVVYQMDLETFNSDSSISVDDLPKIELVAPENLDGETDIIHYYFDYTCYIGGGWHGNIGLVLINADTESAWSACVGDPSGIGDDQVEFALKRSYRGMAWKIDSANQPILEDETNPYSKIKYYSWGVADASEIGGNNEFNHDFLVVSSSEDCNKNYIMDDDTFADNADDFFCLNEIASNASGLIDPNYPAQNDDFTWDGSLSGGVLPSRTNLDERKFDPNRDGTYTNPYDYGYDLVCPYDPTNPPYYVYEGTGSIHLYSPVNFLVSGQSLSEFFYMKTSEGDNCVISSSGFSIVSSRFEYAFVCDLYDYGALDSKGDLSAAGYEGQLFVFDLDEGDDVDISCSNLDQFDYSEIAPADRIKASGNIGTVDCTAVKTNSSEDSGFLLANDTITAKKNRTSVYNLFETILKNDTFNNLPINNLDNIGSITFVPDGITYSLGSSTFEYTAGSDTGIDDTFYYTITLKGDASKNITAKITIDIVNN